MRTTGWHITSNLHTKFKSSYSASSRILALGLISLASFSLAPGILVAQQGGSRASTEQLNKIIEELAEASQLAQRIHAAQLLGQLGDRRATKPLIAALHDSDPGVQHAAALALGQLQDRKAVKPLLRVLQTNSEPSVRGAAAFIAC